MTPDERKLNWSMIGVIAALALQGAGLLVWGGGLNQRVTTLETIVAPLSDGTLARLDERTLAMTKTLERMEQGENAGRR